MTKFIGDMTHRNSLEIRLSATATITSWANMCKEHSRQSFSWLRRRGWSVIKPSWSMTHSRPALSSSDLSPSSQAGETRLQLRSRGIAEHLSTPINVKLHLQGLALLFQRWLNLYRPASQLPMHRLCPYHRQGTLSPAADAAPKIRRLVRACL